MYRGFNLSFNKNYSQFMKKGEELTNEYRIAIRETLDSFVSNEGSLNGSRLQEYWFPQVHADVFISHSHNDMQIATALAGWLSVTFSLKPFVDSCVWGYANELLQQIDNKYCIKPGRNTYDYEKRNGSTSHVHMMLSTALSMMIDNTECLIFLNTPQSISSKDSILKTLSPWLFMEIAMSKVIRRKSPKVHRHIMTIDESIEYKRMEARLKIEYEVNLASLTSIDEMKLMTWRDSYKKGQEYALDVLYRIS